MTLIIDGVFLQRGRRESERLWRALLPLLAHKLDIPVVLLDRGSRGEQIAGIEVVPFPTFKPKFSPHDSALLQRVCTHYGAHAFLSTYFTTPLQTPSVMIVSDMNAEKMGGDLRTREQQEKQTAIAHARRHICTSHSTQDDLLEIYAELPTSHTDVAYCGVDEEIFRPASGKAITTFQHKHGLTRPYFLVFAASKHNEASHESAALLSDALTSTSNADFDVLCIDLDSDNPTSTLMKNGCRILNLALNNENLATAYSGAAALLHPELDQRFGLPIAEAMSCGCPIIATSNRALVEMAPNAVLAIRGSASDELVMAMRSVRDPSIRTQLSAAGLQQAARFRWEPLANTLVKSIHEITAEDRAGGYREFYDTWAKLRAIQGEVDIVP